MRAVEFDTPEVIAPLIKRGAKIDARDKAGRTAAMIAAADGKLSTVKLLLGYGANINAVDGRGRSLLMIAIDDGQNDGYRQRRAEMDDHMEGNGERRRAIQQSELPNRSGHPEIVRLLLAKGADSKVRAKDGSTALSLARKEGFTEVVALLRKAGAR